MFFSYSYTYFNNCNLYFTYFKANPCYLLFYKTLINTTFVRQQSTERWNAFKYS